MSESSAIATFSDLVDLAAASFGGRAIGTNDDFFAGIDNLLQPGRGVFIADKFTERGKWMDGWESRRKRGPGYDWCIVELGATGTPLAFDIDTNHFLGNHAPIASVEGAVAPRGAPLSLVESSAWTTILPQAPLRPGSQNLFVAPEHGVFSHLRLNIFPDGGVARFRVYGRVECDWSRIAAETAENADEVTAQHRRDNEVDLAALKNGAAALLCSDAFFGPMNNLILPGRAENMGGGWESKRRRGPGHDWIIVRLAARGRASLVEIDTNHFKGNFPDRFSLEVIDRPDATLTDLSRTDGWRTLLPESQLKASERQFFRNELRAHEPASHLRLNIFPDGGISRLRVWGVPS